MPPLGDSYRPSYQPYDPRRIVTPSPERYTPRLPETPYEGRFNDNDRHYEPTYYRSLSERIQPDLYRPDQPERLRGEDPGLRLLRRMDFSPRDHNFEPRGRELSECLPLFSVLCMLVYMRHDPHRSQTAIFPTTCRHLAAASFTLTIPFPRPFANTGTHALARFFASASPHGDEAQEDYITLATTDSSQDEGTATPVAEVKIEVTTETPSPTQAAR